MLAFGVCAYHCMAKRLHKSSWESLELSENRNFRVGCKQGGQERQARHNKRTPLCTRTPCVEKTYLVFVDTASSYSTIHILHHVQAVYRAPNDASQILRGAFEARRTSFSDYKN